MPRFLLKIAYDGTDFHGWQKQHTRDSHLHDEVLPETDDPQFAAEIPALPPITIPPSPLEPSSPIEPLRTVQGILESTLQSVLRQPIILTGASRTDAGVHARAQAAAFTADTTIPLLRLPAAINARLPDDLQVRTARLVPPDFDPIREAIRKTYRYRIEHGCRPFIHDHHDRPGYIPSLFNRRYITRTPYSLDVPAMHAAAQHLLGTHDFASFTRINHQRLSTIRTIFSCSVTATHPHRCHIDITGDGFLHNMVRIIAGTLLNVGRAETSPNDIPAILAARDRTAAGPTLPPTGLCLIRVVYPPSRLALQPPSSRL